MNTNCPICDKAGLPDYTVLHIICPQCNSDLKPFLILHSIKNSSSDKTFIYGLIGSLIVAAVFMLLFFNSISETHKIKSENANRFQTLYDSLQILTLTNIELQKTITGNNKKAEKNITIQYIVRSGDYTSKIAQFFYNDWKMYKKIEADNNLTQPYILKVGQKLNININQ